jgi:hypothetical protein
MEKLKIMRMKINNCIIILHILSIEKEKIFLIIG